jgi:hypothetical protein
MGLKTCASLNVSGSIAISRVLDGFPGRLGRSGDALSNPLMTDTQFLREGAQLLVVSHASGEHLSIEGVSRVPGQFDKLIQLHAVWPLRGREPCKLIERFAFRISWTCPLKPVWVLMAFVDQVLMQSSLDAEMNKCREFESSRGVEMSGSSEQEENRL